MSPEPRTLGLIKWIRPTITSLSGGGDRYVSKIITTGKGNHYFTVTEDTGTYIVHVKKIDPEDM